MHPQNVGKVNSQAVCTKVMPPEKNVNICQLPYVVDSPVYQYQTTADSSVSGMSVASFLRPAISTTTTAR